MINLLLILNTLASLTCAAAGAGFFVLLVKSPAFNQRHAFEQHVVRLGIAIVVSGFTFNVIEQTVSPWHEVVVNIGLALMFSWMVYFHYEKWKRKPETH